jgi:hypothetical protein
VPVFVIPIRFEVMWGTIKWSNINNSTVGGVLLETAEMEEAEAHKGLESMIRLELTNADCSEMTVQHMM